jgi:hypothetical protein
MGAGSGLSMPLLKKYAELVGVSWAVSACATPTPTNGTLLHASRAAPTSRTARPATLAMLRLPIRDSDHTSLLGFGILA